MAESSELQCDPCNYKNVTKSASIWCTDCKTGLCEECCISHKALKISRNHHVIPAEVYQRTKAFNINVCPDHSIQLDFYCPTHDSAVYVVCVQLKHCSCKDLKPVDKAAKDAKTSTAFSDLEETIHGLLENIEKGVQHLHQSKTNLREQEEVTKKLIEINKHLDYLEEKLLKAITTKSEKAVNEISLMTTKLEAQRKNILDLKDAAQNMKQFSSNMQVFVGVRSILITVVNERNVIKLLVNSIPQLNIAVQFNPKFDKFSESFDSLGEIQITSTEAVVPYVERQLMQAQYQRPAEPPVYKLDNLQLKLRTIINKKKYQSNKLFNISK